MTSHSLSRLIQVSEIPNMIEKVLFTPFIGLLKGVNKIFQNQIWHFWSSVELDQAGRPVWSYLF